MKRKRLLFIQKCYGGRVLSCGPPQSRGSGKPFPRRAGAAKVTGRASMTSAGRREPGSGPGLGGGGSITIPTKSVPLAEMAQARGCSWCHLQRKSHRGEREPLFWGSQGTLGTWACLGEPLKNSQRIAHNSSHDTIAFPQGVQGMCTLETLQRLLHPTGLLLKFSFATVIGWTIGGRCSSGCCQWSNQSWKGPKRSSSSSPCLWQETGLSGNQGKHQQCPPVGLVDTFLDKKPIEGCEL